MYFTMTEWLAREAEIVQEVTRRWPWLMRPYRLVPDDHVLYKWEP